LIFGKLLDKLIDNKKKMIFLVFKKYIMNKLKCNMNVEIQEYEEFTIYEKELLDFKIVMNKFNQNKMYFDLLEDDLNKFYKIEKKTEYKKEKKETRYISVNYQKKHGVFKKQHLEIESKKDELIKIKLTRNDNSFLKIKLEKDDDFNDLEPLSKPMYLKDCILGLNSEYPDRQRLSLTSIPEIILNKPFDLEYIIDELTETLLKLGNSFEIENFDEMVNDSLIKLTNLYPVKMTQLLCKRFFLEECGIKQKFQILDIIEKSSEDLSKVQKKLLIFYENIIFPLLNYLRLTKIDVLLTLKDYDYLLARFLSLVAKLIKLSENHPFIYKSLFESFNLFKAISQMNEKSTILISSLNYYTNVLSKFINDTFIHIYPEFLECINYILTFLKDLNPKDNELKIEIMQNLNNYVFKLEKLNFSINSINKDLLL